jgi:hypothetical protein
MRKPIENIDYESKKEACTSNYHFEEVLLVYPRD